MTEDTWSAIFSEAGGQYRPPVLVMFTDATRSACGLGSSATGPFYCPPDERIYIDLGFFNDLAQMAGISSSEFDFAAAYVIAHEVGHHVQNLLGTSDEVRQAQARSPGEANRLSVLLELQADCFAGVWANRTRAPDGRSMLEPGDVQEGMRAAAAIGDDRLARSAGRSVSPESFTHGTSEQRRHWLETGLESGMTESCDTFAQAGYR
jgi:predicted metalloprotease